MVDVRYWHKADMRAVSGDVLHWGKADMPLHRHHVCV